VAKQKTLNNTEQVKTSSKLLGLGILAVTITVIPEAADPFNTPKLIILCLLGAWLLGTTMSSFRKNAKNKIRFKTPVMILSLFFCTSLGLATLFTDVKTVALIGETQRRNGLLAYLSLVSIFIYISNVCTVSFMKSILNFTLLTCALVATYGVIQVFGFDFINWNNPYNSMISTLGNPNFASSLLAILVVLLFFGVVLTNYAKPYKIFSIFVIMLSIFAILGSKSLQGVLVVLISSLIYICLFFHRNKIKTYRFILVFSFILMNLTLLGMLQKGPLQSFLYKESVSIRGYYWRAGIEMLKSNPVFGIGIDSYGDYFKQFREPGYVLKYGYEIGSTNAHNTVIQLFATGGIFVGISYLLILFYILYSGIKLIYETNGNDQKVIIAIFSAWVGFIAQSLISIDNIGISVWGWVLGGALIGLRKQFNDINIIDQQLQVQSRNKNLVDIEVFRPVLTVLIVIPTLILSFNVFRSETDLYKLRSLLSSNSPQAKPYLEEFAKKIISNKFSDPMYKYESIVALIQIGFTAEGNQAFNELYTNNQRNLTYLNALAFSEQELKKSISAIKYREMIAIYDPWNAKNYEQLYYLYSSTENNFKANEIRDKLLSFAPESDQAKNVMKAEAQT